MNKSKVITGVIMTLLCVIAIVVLNKDIIVKTGQNDNRAVTDENVKKNADKIITQDEINKIDNKIDDNKIEKDGTVTEVEDGLSLTEGKYDFGDELIMGIYEFTSQSDGMRINGKMLNKGCKLLNYYGVSEDKPLYITGDGTVTARVNTEAEKEMEDDKVVITSSGYYCDFLLFNRKDIMEGDINVYSEGLPEGSGPIVIREVDLYGNEYGAFMLNSDEERLQFKVTPGQWFYVDFGEETVDWGCKLVVETVGEGLEDDGRD